MQSDLTWLQQIVQQARRRWWQERLLWEGRWALVAAAFVAGIGAWGAAWVPALAVWSLVGIALCGGGWLLRLLTIARGRPQDQRLRRLLDARLRLPDELLAAGELANPAPLAAIVSEQARRHAETLVWSRDWPLPRIRSHLLAGACLVIWGGLLLYTAWVTSQEPGPWSMRDKWAVRAVAFESLQEDWEKAAETEVAADFSEFAAAMKPLIEEMQTGELTQHDVARELTALDEQLAARQAELETRSWEDLSASLAEAMEAVAGLGPTAAALRREAFDAAAREAGKAAERLEKKQSPAIDEDSAAETTRQLQALAESLQDRGNDAMAGAVRRLAEGVRDQNNPSMAQGMRQLQSGMGEQAKEGRRQEALAMGREQLEALKRMNAANQSHPSGFGPGHLANAFGAEPGREAGQADGANPAGAPGEEEGERELAAITGQFTEGDSVVTTRESAEGSAATTSAGQAADFATYEKLSFEAVRNENLPLNHREVIRRYFEGIRPATQPGE